MGVPHWQVYLVSTRIHGGQSGLPKLSEVIYIYTRYHTDTRDGRSIWPCQRSGQEPEVRSLSSKFTATSSAPALTKVTDFQKGLVYLRPLGSAKQVAKAVLGPSTEAGNTMAPPRTSLAVVAAPPAPTGLTAVETTTWQRLHVCKSLAYQPSNGMNPLLRIPRS